MRTDFTDDFSPRKFAYFPTTPFEEYMRLDQKSDFPMTQEMLWTFAGTVDPDVLRAALQTTIAREPLYGATVRRRFRPFGRFYWRIPQTPPTNFSSVDVPFDFLDEKAGSIPLSTLDLEQASGFRVRLERGPNSFRLVTSTHHAVADGLGIARFVGRLFDVYESLLVGEKIAPERLARIEAFPNRGRFCPKPIEPPIPPRTLARIVVGEIARWFWRRPVALGDLLRRRRSRSDATIFDAEKSPQEASFQAFAQTFAPRRAAVSPPTIHWLRLPADFFAEYRRRARAQNVGVNALLLRDIFLALKNWTQSELGVDDLPKRRYFRVLIPTSLRGPEDVGIPAANRLGFAFLDKKPREISADAAFLKELSDATTSIRKWSSGAIFLDGVRFFRRLPGALSLLTSRIFCHSTLVFSNVGVLCKTLEQKRFQEAETIEIAGKLKLVGIVGAPPVRPNTPLSIGVVAHNGEAFVSFCVDERSFDAARFLAFFRELTRNLRRRDDEEKTPGDVRAAR